MSEKCYSGEEPSLDGEGYIYATDVEEARRLIMDEWMAGRDIIAIGQLGVEVTDRWNLVPKAHDFSR